MTTHTFGERLRAARQSAGKSLRDVAMELGCSVPYLSDVERGRRGPLSGDKLEMVARVLNEHGLLDASARERAVLDLRGLTPKQRALVVAYVAKLRGSP